MKRRGLIIGLIVFVLLFLYALAAGGCAKSYDRKLVDCDRNPVETTFVCPRGDTRQILLGVPKSSKPDAFVGRLKVSDEESGETVCDTAFTASDVQSCSWLNDDTVNGYILTWGNEPWHEKTKSKHSYRVVVHFDKAPSSGSSLWLFWENSDLFPL